MGGHVDRMVTEKKVAYIFPGQGAQYVGMGKDLYDNFDEAKDVFDAANEISGVDIKDLCFNGPMGKLSTTEFSQPAILTVSIAALRSLKQRMADIEAKAALGLSLGEYSALVSAGSIALEDAIRLVTSRGRFMEEASKENPGKMASVLGLDRAALEEICKEAGCEIANINCPGQIVISGKDDSIDRAIAGAKDKGAKRSIILEVSGPFHSSLMKSASSGLKTVLDDIEIKKPAIPFVSNVNASYEHDGGKIKENLLSQLTGTTYWEDSIRLLVKDGVDTFFEIGPGKVLKGLLRRIDPSLKVYSIATVEDIENLASDFAGPKVEVGGK